jgi:hypothetical protein
MTPKDVPSNREGHDDEWLPEESAEPSGTDASIAEKAFRYQRRISQHVPSSMDEEWGNWEPTIPVLLTLSGDNSTRSWKSASKVVARLPGEDKASKPGKPPSVKEVRHADRPSPDGQPIGMPEASDIPGSSGVDAGSIPTNDQVNCDDEIRHSGGSTNDYNEDSIQIVRVDLDPRFDWRLAEEWANKYRRDVKFILRGILACRECCVCPTWFLHRYLQRNPDAPRREDVEEAHKRLLEEERAKKQSPGTI